MPLALPPATPGTDTVAVVAAAAASACWLLAVAAFVPLAPGGAGSWPPLALAGARGAASAVPFNALAFVAPGMLAAVVAWRARSAASPAATWTTRLGWQCVLLSALAFAAQGLLPLDPDDLDNAASRGHAVAWTLWWIGFVPAGLLLASAALAPGHRRVAAALHLCAALVVGLVAWTATGPGGQWLATATWLAWLLLATVAGPRAARRA